MSFLKEKEMWLCGSEDMMKVIDVSTHVKHVESGECDAMAHIWCGMSWAGMDVGGSHAVGGVSASEGRGGIIMGCGEEGKNRVGVGLEGGQIGWVRKILAMWSIWVQPEPRTRAMSE